MLLSVVRGVDRMTTAWIVGDCWIPKAPPPVEWVHHWAEQPPTLFIANLEGSVPASPQRVGRRSLLSLDPCRLRDLAVSKTTICILANNHVTDYGPAGVLATLQAVREAGMQPLGAGATLQEARQPVILQVGDRRLGLLAYADSRAHVGSWVAGETTPGVAPLFAEWVVDDVSRLRHSVDDLWLFLHWGREYIRFPEPEQRALAREFVRAGATLVVGTHPHLLQGWERVEGASVYYSLGNFIFPSVPYADGTVFRWDSVCRQGIILKGVLESNGWQWSPIPHRADRDGNPRNPGPQARKTILSTIAWLSGALDNAYLQRYPYLLRKEYFLSRVRRLMMMGWGEWLRLPPRLLKHWSDRFRS